MAVTSVARSDVLSRGVLALRILKLIGNPILVFPVVGVWAAGPHVAETRAMASQRTDGDDVTRVLFLDPLPFIEQTRGLTCLL